MADDKCRQGGFPPQLKLRQPLTTRGTFSGTVPLVPTVTDVPAPGATEYSLPGQDPVDPGRVLGITTTSGPLSALAIACFYVLVGRANVRFPFTTRSKPSELVRVERASFNLLRAGDYLVFPQIVDWRRWDTAVVPVLEDPALQPLTGINTLRLQREAFDEYLVRIQDLLLQSFRAAGFLP